MIGVVFVIGIAIGFVAGWIVSEVAYASIKKAFKAHTLDQNELIEEYKQQLSRIMEEVLKQKGGAK